jgi:putative flippase GtrA
MMNNAELRRFIKFCIVGASSTVITFAVLNLCKFHFDLPLFTSVTIAFVFGVCNGFFWNRKWTFKQARANSAQEQSAKFLAVNLVGYLLNQFIVVMIVAHVATGDSTRFFGDMTHLKVALYTILAGEGKTHYGPLLVNGAQAVAVCIVVFWNYFANRHWTFKH